MSSASKKVIQAAAGNAGGGGAFYSYYKESYNNTSSFGGINFDKEEDGSLTMSVSSRISDTSGRQYVRKIDLGSGDLTSRFEYLSNHITYTQYLTGPLHYRDDENAVYFASLQKGATGLATADFLVEKWSTTDGSAIWRKVFDISANSVDYINGGFLRFFSNGDPCVCYCNNSSSYDALVSTVRFNKSNGNITWQKHWGADSTGDAATLKDLLIDDNDNVLILLSANTFPQSGMLTKLNSSGVWQSTLGLWRPDRALNDPYRHFYADRLMKDKDGNIHMSCYFSETSDNRNNDVLHSIKMEIDPDATTDTTYNVTMVSGGGDASDKSSHEFFYDPDTNIYYQVRNLSDKYNQATGSNGRRFSMGLEAFKSRQQSGTSERLWRFTVGASSNSAPSNAISNIYPFTDGSGFVYHHALQGTTTDHHFMLSPVLGNTDYPSVGNATLDSTTYYVQADKATADMSMDDRQVLAECYTGSDWGSGYIGGWANNYNVTHTWSNTTVPTMTADTGDASVDETDFEDNFNAL